MNKATSYGTFVGGPIGGRGIYSSIHVGLLRDSRLSAAAKGIFAFLSACDDGLHVSEESIADATRGGRSQEGLEAIRTALDELEEHHYLIRNRTGWFYTDLPAQLVELGVNDPEVIATKVAEAFNESQAAGKHTVT